ncbi:DMT family transporter [Paenibacillus flagellatus]|uniref:QacE family quaternary ammonium compound efflux SMR transporter n=1 Tax=Paenibacillus flagellatus TaxID=2211139 RepID=A0A2V5K5G2_9BACL|nr:multidrug efflux SMR transporter [Paenibacillus flagellatus]PYI54591.1 QacE family quaternary ammonium compound efflux SMR transporter [Paenibacillus flagellatus]
MNAWLYLAAAIVLEVAGTTSMKLAQGFTRPLPSALMIVFYLTSFSSLTMALKKIEVSTAYAIWSGVGIAAISVIGALWFHESFHWRKALFIILIVAGVVGLQMSGDGHGSASPPEPAQADAAGK